MKTILFLGVAAVLVLAQDQSTTSNKPADKKPKSQATSTPPVRPKLHKGQIPPVVPPLTAEQKAAAALPTVPKGAQPVGPNLFRYTDAQGKTWMYRQTPFGVSKWEEKPGEEQNAEAAPKPLPATATDLGDKVQFERDTPFGHQKWIVNKSDLTPDEKATLDAQKQTAGAVKNDAVKNSEKQ